MNKLALISLFVSLLFASVGRADGGPIFIAMDDNGRQDSLIHEPGGLGRYRWTTTKKLPLKAEVMNEEGTYIWAGYFIDGRLVITKSQFPRGKYRIIFSDPNGRILSESFLCI